MSRKNSESEYQQEYQQRKHALSIQIPNDLRKKLLPLIIHCLSYQLLELPSGIVPDRTLGLLHEDADDVFLWVGKILGVEVAAPAEGETAFSMTSSKTPVYIYPDSYPAAKT